MCFILINFCCQLVFLWHGLVSRDKTPISNIALFEYKGSTYDGSLCDFRPGNMS
jgi:hypothetical protein